jgi:hypothetical protein
MLLITLGRYFPKPMTAAQIFCPHEHRIQTGVQTRFIAMVGIFFVPLLPVARIFEWRCQSCANKVEQNIDGSHSRRLKRGYIFLGLFGFIIFALFAFVVCYIGGKDSAFALETINVARGLFGLFAAGGVWIMIKAMQNYRRAANELNQMVKLSPERTAALLAVLQPGDDIQQVILKLTAQGFTENEINTFLKTWMVPEM